VTPVAEGAIKRTKEREVLKHGEMFYSHLATEEESRKVLRVTSAVLINRRAADVFEYIADFSKNPEWQKGMKSAEWTSEPPIAVGSTYDQVAQFLGKRIVTSFEVVEFEPGRKVRITSTSGSFPITVTREVEPASEATCEVSALVEGDSTGFFRLAAPLMRWMVGRSVKADYARLKQIMEQPA